MNKKIQSQNLKRQLKSARIMQQVAMQQFTIATQLEGEAISGLEALGERPGRPPEGLHEDVRLALIGGLTGKKGGK